MAEIGDILSGGGSSEEVSNLIEALEQYVADQTRDDNVRDVVDITPSGGGGGGAGGGGGGTTVAVHQHNDGGSGGSQLSPSQIILPSVASPAQSREGEIVWDSDGDFITVGDGSGRHSTAMLENANVFTANQTISNAAPTLIFTDTTASAKGMTVVVDGNVANFRESAGAAGSLLVLDLANNFVGLGVSPTKLVDVATNNATAANREAAFSLYNSGTTGFVLVLQKSKHGTVGSHTVVASGDVLGQLQARGSDGSAFIGAASVRFAVDGEPGTNDMPGRIEFLTTADGSASLTTRGNMDSAGKFNWLSAINLAAITPTVVAGDIYNDSTQLKHGSFTNGLAGWFERTIWGAYAEVTHTGIVTSQSLFSATALGTRTLPANFWKPGKALRVNMHGHYTTDASAGNATIDIKFGTTTYRTTGSFALDGNVTDGFWNLDFVVYCLTTGMTGTIGGSCNWMHAQATGGSQPMHEEPFTTHTPVTLDTTAAATFDIQWTATDAGTTLHVDKAFISELM